MLHQLFPSTKYLHYWNCKFWRFVPFCSAEARLGKTDETFRMASIFISNQGNCIVQSRDLTCLGCCKENQQQRWRCCFCWKSFSPWSTVSLSARCITKLDCGIPSQTRWVAHVDVMSYWIWSGFSACFEMRLVLVQNCPRHCTRRGTGGSPVMAPFFKIMQFSGNFEGKPRFWANVG